MNKKLSPFGSPAIDNVVWQLLQLSCCSNARLHSTGMKLQLIDGRGVAAEAFNQYVADPEWRHGVPTHYKRGQCRIEGLPDLSGCRLESNARLQFSVRLVPVSVATRDGFAMRRPGGIVIPDAERGEVFGVLAVVQELCSGLIQAEMLMNDAPTLESLCALDTDKLIDFVARAISLPKLKCAGIHFPIVNCSVGAVTRPTNGLVEGWLGVRQPSTSSQVLDDAFSQFAERVIERAGWGARSYLIKPDRSIFKMDFPSQDRSKMLDVRKGCRRGWATHTLTRQLMERLDRYNTVMDADGMSPLLRLWIGRLCYYRVHQSDDVIAQASLRATRRASLEAMFRDISYRKRIPPTEIAVAVEAGFKLLETNAYQTTK